LLLWHALAFVHVAPFDCFDTHTVPLHHASLAQSASLAQLVVHDEPTHKNGSQLVAVATCLHVPAPSHCCASTVVPEHTFAPHPVPLGAFTLPAQLVRVAPSQTGVAHAVPAPHCARGPCGAPDTARQLPGCPATSHASHSPVQSALQQKPSTQIALAQSTSLPHDCPIFSLHAPFASHVWVPVHESGSGPFVTCLHAPVVSHVVHAPVHEAAQQFPLHEPDAHSPFVAHVAPFAEGTYEQNVATVAGGLLAVLHDVPFNVPHVK
jgi:hypothetical protein